MLCGMQKQVNETGLFGKERAQTLLPRHMALAASS
jgi:hypothetical protein